MREDISKILKMMERGTIDSEKATDLIELLKENESMEADANDNYLQRTLKIRVRSKEDDNVNVNLPLNIVHTFLRAGQAIAMNIPQAEKYVKDLDLDVLIHAIENELVGEVVNVESEEETVHIFIE